MNFGGKDVTMIFSTAAQTSSGRCNPCLLHAQMKNSCSCVTILTCAPRAWVMKHVHVTLEALCTLPQQLETNEMENKFLFQ